MIIHDSTLIMHLISVTNLNLNIKFWKQNKENRNNNKIKRRKKNAKRTSPATLDPSLSLGPASNYPARPNWCFPRVFALSHRRVGPTGQLHPLSLSLLRFVRRQHAVALLELPPPCAVTDSEPWDSVDYAPFPSRCGRSASSRNRSAEDRPSTVLCLFLRSDFAAGV
jgi:hypothetical protein